VGIPSQKKSATSSTISHSIVLQAMFYPNRKFEENKEISWIGYLYTWWLYNTRVIQNVREDTNENFSLDISEDRILEWVLDEDGKLTIKAYKSKANGAVDNSTEPLIYNSFDEAHPVWEAGEKLSLKSPNERKIYTTDGNSLIEFSVDNLNEFKNFLGTNESNFPSCLIRSNGSIDYQRLVEYVRGIDFPGCRSRTVDEDNDTWKLGDIIYSTPWIEKYDNYTVAFVGANDGMLHAFRVGYLKRNLSSNSPVSIQNDRSDNGTELLGEELWAFIPKNVLPYLRFLSDPNYKHMYFVDLKPYVVNVDNRKILIGGMRLGGGVGCSDTNCINPPSDTCPDADSSNCAGLSSYFALDVTDPENPRFLLEFTNPNLGFSYSGPAFVTYNSKHYVVFASGPTNYRGESSQDLKLFVLKLDDNFKIDKTWVIDSNVTSAFSNLNNAFGGRLFTKGIDYDKDNNTDYFFFGVTYKDGNNWKGNVIAVHVDNEDPTKWEYSKIFNHPCGPITSRVKIGKCFDRYFIYFGTGRWFYKNDDPGKETGSDENRIYGVDITPCLKGTVSSCNVNALHENPSNACKELAGRGKVAGWYRELDPKSENYMKERLISDPTLTNQNVVFFSTIEPTDDPCGFGGRSRVWALNCATGGTIYSTCPSGKYAVSPPEGKLYLQLSGANIIVINPKTEFGTNEENASPYSEWYEGIAPETGAPFVGYSKGLVRKLLFWIER
jgi:type IV pilus assembly protein PilY1